jgi:hypothetical protein
MSRRDVLRIGALGMGGLTLSDLLRLQARGAVEPTARRKAVIMIFLYGGPSHIDTYDMKPDAPDQIRGEFKPIQTNVSGIDIAELMPCQARIADKLALIRGLRFDSNDHVSDWVFRGTFPDIKRPVFGSVVSRLCGSRGLPPYVALGGEFLSDPGDPAYLGMAHRPFTPTGAGLANLGLARDMTLERLDDRKALLQGLDTFRRDLDTHGNLAGMDSFTARALQMIASPSTRAAFDLGAEPDKVRARYGKVPQLLLARRLVEAGVSVVTLSLSNAVLGGHWDTHAFDQPGRKVESGFSVMRRVLPLYDRLIYTLVSDLHDRGLDKDVAVVAWGEFGRTPKINKNGGRDHWGPAGSVLFAGGGFRTGQVIGATGPQGDHSRTTPYKPCNVLATLYHFLGIDLETTLPDFNGRPMYLLENRKVIQELL